jgi:uncharacterized protein YeaO (DUF488 family)
MVAGGVDVRRIYDDRQGTDDEYRVLVDRLWPRGVSTASVRLDEWAKDLAPSTALRTWYGHDPARFDEFAHRYQEELGAPGPVTAADSMLQQAGARRLVLLTATRDVEHSGATVLAAYLRRR